MATFSTGWMRSMLLAANLPPNVEDIVGKNFIFEFSCEGKGTQAVAGKVTAISLVNDEDTDEVGPESAETHLVLEVSTQGWYGMRIKGLWWRESATWNLNVDKDDMMEFFGNEDMELPGTPRLF